MRLINIDTCKLESFNEVDLPEYGILSHTWEGEEVQFSEMINFSMVDLRSKPKYCKIRGCFKVAQNDNLKYIWVDTCCIDKSSSAELQEAINSMFRWYENAEVCYVFLSDHAPAQRMDGGLLEKCRWVTRGWTLQELIAPSVVKFYAKDWSLLGDKKKDVRHVSIATGIDSDILENGDLSDASIAQRMSWAAKRNCTRSEDVAYSLMGLFGINMPMLYGEGDRAFVRLQEEIIRTTFDFSIFAWTDMRATRMTYRSLLARSPADFKSCAKVSSETSFDISMPFSITNLGIHINATLYPLEGEKDIYLFPLTNVNEKGVFLKNNLAVYLKRLSPQSKQFIRWKPNKIFRFENNTRLSLLLDEEIFVRQRPVIPKSHETSCMYGFLIRKLKGEYRNEIGLYGLTGIMLRVWPPTAWSDSQKLLRIDPFVKLAVGVVWFDTGRRGLDIPWAIVLSFEKSSGQGQIAVVDNIPSDIKESKLGEVIANVLSSRKSIVRNGAESKDFSKVQRNGLSISISSHMYANLFMDRVVLDISVDMNYIDSAKRFAF